MERCYAASSRTALAHVPLFRHGQHRSSLYYNGLVVLKAYRSRFLLILTQCSPGPTFGSRDIPMLLMSSNWKGSSKLQLGSAANGVILLQGDSTVETTYHTHTLATHNSPTHNSPTYTALAYPGADHGHHHHQYATNPTNSSSYRLFDAPCTWLNASANGVSRRRPHHTTATAYQQSSSTTGCSRRASAYGHALYAESIPTTAHTDDSRRIR